MRRGRWRVLREGRRRSPWRRSWTSTTRTSSWHPICATCGAPRSPPSTSASPSTCASPRTASFRPSTRSGCWPRGRRRRTRPPSCGASAPSFCGSWPRPGTAGSASICAASSGCTRSRRTLRTRRAPAWPARFWRTPQAGRCPRSPSSWPPRWSSISRSTGGSRRGWPWRSSRRPSWPPCGTIIRASGRRSSTWRPPQTRRPGRRSRPSGRRSWRTVLTSGSRGPRSERDPGRSRGGVAMMMMMMTTATASTTTRA
mmetsp:Transcript_99253/g.250604  ORF Transcript_99253/g.250604 Transcript_99253/m.250604 type:complete len:256 (+) Transcript_99253:581-1348(+)